MSASLDLAASQIRHAVRAATEGLVGREQLAELIVLAAVAQEHILVVGPPGTAKSAVVRRVAQSMGGRYFEYLLGRFTEPSELFGTVDLKKLREGTVETDISGMLPEADIVFLDEVFLGSTAILNTLLGVLNERRFRRGHTQVQCPLRVCVAAANGLPDDESLAAFGDRFLLHLFVDAVPDNQLEAMLAGGWQSEQRPVPQLLGLTQLDTLGHALKDVDLSLVRPALAQAIRRLREAGIQLSDRRIVKSQRLIAAAALLRGHLQASEADLWPLLCCCQPGRSSNTAARFCRIFLPSAATAICSVPSRRRRCNRWLACIVCLKRQRIIWLAANRPHPRCWKRCCAKSMPTSTSRPFPRACMRHADKWPIC
ncbi:AAA family ATPase [Pseudomonas corrugata]